MYYYLRNNLSFAPRNGQTRSITMNLVLDSSKSFAEELNAIFNILPLPLHVRIGARHQKIFN